jgi:hypothetical protein
MSSSSLLRQRCCSPERLANESKSTAASCPWSRCRRCRWCPRCWSDKQDQTCRCLSTLRCCYSASQSSSWRRAATFVVIALALGAQVPASSADAISQGNLGPVAISGCHYGGRCRVPLLRHRAHVSSVGPTACPANGSPCRREGLTPHDPDASTTDGVRLHRSMCTHEPHQMCRGRREGMLIGAGLPNPRGAGDGRDLQVRGLQALQGAGRGREDLLGAPDRGRASRSGTTSGRWPTVATSASVRWRGSTRCRGVLRVPRTLMSARRGPASAGWPSG